MSHENNNGRLSERVQKELQAELSAGGKIYDAIIENLSENGMKIRIASIDIDVNFSPDKIVSLEFEIPSGEMLSLNCQIVWSDKVSAGSLIQDIGLKITETYPVYEDYYKSLFMDTMSFL